MNKTGFNIRFSRFFGRRPNAAAYLMGSESYPDVFGTVNFYKTSHGVLVVAEVLGLPKSQNGKMSGVFAFHIHGGSSCTGTQDDPFANAQKHYDTQGNPHPYHAGDMPPLFSAHGQAFSAFLTDRFAIEEIIGKTVIIHDMPDDFTSQPSGNSGKKIACGEIKSYK